VNAHGIVIRAWREREGHWLATAEAVPEGIARAAVAGGDLPGTAAARAAQCGRPWPVETALGSTEADATTEALRRLLARGLEPTRGA
jgi:hypothetical protein